MCDKIATNNLMLTVRKITYTLSVGFLFALGVCSTATAQDISDIPLSVGGNVTPNLVLTIDDSGSMAYGYLGTFNQDRIRAGYRSSHRNLQYYNPSIVYTPPSNPDGTILPNANFNDAILGYYHPTANQHRVDLRDDYAAIWRSFVEFNRKFLLDDALINTENCPPDICASQQAYYFEFDDSNSGCSGTDDQKSIDDDCYTKVVISPAEEQNFANWYQYYSTRGSAAKSALFRVFTEDNVPDSLRIARQSFNEFTTIASGNGSNRLAVLGENNERENLYEWIRNIDPGGSTPLRSAAIRAGEFFTRDNAYYEDPDDSSSNITSCRANAHLLVTDGSYNGNDNTIPSLSRHDNATFTLPDARSYNPGDASQLIYPNSLDDKSFADIAFHYWATDLYGDATDNQVAPFYVVNPDDPDAPVDGEYWNPANDPANWQHMTTYSVGFGLSGTVPVPDAEVYTQLLLGNYTNIDGDLGWPEPRNATRRADDIYHAGVNGRGGFYSATDPNSLVGAFARVLQNISARQASASTIVADSGRIAADSLLYVARYNTDDWTGELIAFDVSDGSSFDPDAPTAGGCNSQQLGTLCGEVWDASEINTESTLPHDTRNIYTYNPNFNAGENPIGTGIEFKFADLNNEQLTSLSTVSTTGAGGGSQELCPVLDESHPSFNSCDNNGFNCLSVLTELPCDGLSNPVCYAVNPNWPNSFFGRFCTRFGFFCEFAPIVTIDCPETTSSGIGNSQGIVDYIRGDSSNEEQNNGNFRERSETRLGPVFHTSPTYVGNGTDAIGLQQFDFPDDLESASYSSFVSSVAGRTPMVYVGANDGMLHAYNAERTGGNELFSYIPNAVIGELNELADPEFDSNSYVDGPIRVQDAFINGSWATMLVGGLRSGGQAYYALDVTNPDTAGSANAASDLVLWEFSDKNDADMGFSTGAAQVVRANNGRWVVLIGNGHLSETADDYPGTGKAVLFALDAETGAVLTKIDVGQGTASDPNGLSTPTAVLANNDDLNVDYAYAGDLHGNMWRFDLTDANPSNWDATLLFTTSNGQPITGAPTIGSHPNGLEGQVVYFGTGRYLGEGDLPDGNQQSLYAILDDYTCNNTSTPCVSRSNLLEQSIATNFGTSSASVTDNIIDWSTHEGWFFDLPPSNTASERVAGQPQLIGPSVVFLTIVPKLDPCDDGGFNRLYVLNRGNGGTTLRQLIDTNGDGVVDDSDQQTNSSDELEVVSIIRTSNDDPVTELKFFADTGEENANGGCSEAVATGLNLTCFSNGSRTNRIRWRQLQ